MKKKAAPGRASTPEKGQKKRPKKPVAAAVRGGPRQAAAPAPRARKKRKAVPRVDPAAILERLDAAIPDPHVELAFETPWQLLIAVILSAQSTDRNVNRVTPELFRRWATPEALGSAAQEDVEVVVKSTGFFRNKAKAIRGASRLLVERFGGQVPRSIEELIQVPGVARKTANVVLGAAYGVSSGVVTDTHAMRVSQRLGLTEAEAPEKIELDLCRQFPESRWIALSHQLVLHGRHWCTARAPRCTRCALNELCPAAVAPPEASWQERARDEAEHMSDLAYGFTQALRAARASAPPAP
jgi:endonuclease-3